MLKRIAGCANHFNEVLSPNKSARRSSVGLREKVPHFLTPWTRLVPRRSHQVADAAKEDAARGMPPSKGIVGYLLGRGVYQFVAAVFAVLSSMNVFASTCLCRWQYGVAMAPAIDLGFRTLGAMMMVVAAVSYALQTAMAANNMHTPTSKRLAFAFTFALVGMCYCKVPYLLQGHPMPARGIYKSSFIQLLPLVTFFRVYGLGTLREVIPGMQASAFSALRPKSLNSALYSFLSVGFMVQGIASVLFPTRFAPSMFGESPDAFCVFLFQISGFMKYLLSIVCFTLKEGVEKGCLGETPFKILNLSTWYAASAILLRIVYTQTVGAAAAGTESIAFSPTAWLTTFALFGTLAIVSGFNAIGSTKKD